MVMLWQPKKVTLPNSTTFYARYKRLGGNVLPDNVTINHTYQQRARREKFRRVLKDVLTKAFFFVRKPEKSVIGRNLAEIAVENLPREYHASVKRIKNKQMKKILQSDFAVNALDMIRAYVYDKLG